MCNISRQNNVTGLVIITSRISLLSTPLLALAQDPGEAALSAAMLQSSAKCSLKTAEFRHDVRIEDFAAWGKEAIDTPEFEVAGKRWCLRVFPYGEKEEDSDIPKNHVTVFLVLKTPGLKAEDEPVRVKCG